MYTDHILLVEVSVVNSVLVYCVFSVESHVHSYFPDVVQLTYSKPGTWILT